ncbi:MAG: GtrA family protein [Janthinobacterium lividum]
MHITRLLKGQAAAAASTALDFLTTIICVEVFHSWYLLATALGNAAGGITNFYLGRHLVFEASRQQARPQGVRYFLVWLGSLLLNAGGVYLCTQLLHANYLYSKALVALVVGLGFNYTLQLHFVFKQS